MISTDKWPFTNIYILYTHTQISILRGGVIAVSEDINHIAREEGGWGGKAKDIDIDIHFFGNDIFLISEFYV